MVREAMRRWQVRGNVEFLAPRLTAGFLAVGSLTPGFLAPTVAQF